VSAAGWYSSAGAARPGLGVQRDAAYPPACASMAFGQLPSDLNFSLPILRFVMGRRDPTRVCGTLWGPGVVRRPYSHDIAFYTVIYIFMPWNAVVA
jgi:hypothetical protein